MSAAAAPPGMADPGDTRRKLDLLLHPSDDPRWADDVRSLDAGDALQVLAEVLSDPRRPERIRRQAALIVGVLGDPRGVAVLEAATRDPEPRVRRRALESLTALGPHALAAADVVVSAAGDADALVRREATRTIAALALPEAPAILADLAASDPAPEVRRAAEEATRALEGGSA